MTIIIGIDPGSINTGYGIIRKVGSRIEHIDSGVISIKGSDINSRLPIIFTRLHEILQQYKPDHMVIEQVFLADNPQSAIKLGMARGVAILAGSLCQCVIFELSARQAKKFVTGMGNAQKEQVNRMVCRMLGLQDPPRLDASDALALAISHAQTINTRLLIAAKSQALVNNRSQRRLAQNTHNHQVLSEMVEQFEGEREVDAERAEGGKVAGAGIEGVKSIESIKGIEGIQDEVSDKEIGLGTHGDAVERAANGTTSNTLDCANSTNYTNFPNFEQHNPAAPTQAQAHAETSESAVSEATTSRQISDESLNFTSDLIAAISQQLSEQRQANWEEELRSGAGYHPSWMEDEMEDEMDAELEVDIDLELKHQVIDQEEIEQEIAACKVIEQEAQEDQKIQEAQEAQDAVPTTVLATQAQDKLDAQVTNPASDSQTVLAALINSDLTQLAPLSQVAPAQISETNRDTTSATTTATVATVATLAKVATVNTATSALSNPATLAHNHGFASSSPSYNPVLQSMSWERRSNPTSVHLQQNTRARGNFGATTTNLGTSANQLTSKAQLRALVQSQFGKINGSQLSNSNKLSALARNSQVNRTVTGNATATARNNATSSAHSAGLTASSKLHNVSQLANVTQSSDQELLRHTQNLNLTLSKANPSASSITNCTNLEVTNHEPTQGIQATESSPNKFADKLVSNREATSNFQVQASTTPHNATATPMHDTLSQLMSELTTQGVDKVLQQLDGNLSSNASTPAVTNLNVTLTAEQLELDRASLSNFKINAKRFQVKTGKSSNRTKLETKIKKSRKQDT